MGSESVQWSNTTWEAKGDGCPDEALSPIRRRTRRCRSTAATRVQRSTTSGSRRRLRWARAGRPPLMRTRASITTPGEGVAGGRRQQWLPAASAAAAVVGKQQGGGDQVQQHNRHAAIQAL